MTKAAQHFGKDVRDFMYADTTKEYIDALSKCGKFPQLVAASRGRYGGTWAHPKLAVFFARWLDVRFAVWCDAVIEDILKGVAQVTIKEPEKSAALAQHRETTDRRSGVFGVLGVQHR